MNNFKIWEIEVQSQKYSGEYETLLIHAKTIIEAIRKVPKHTYVTKPIIINNVKYLGITDN